MTGPVAEAQAQAGTRSRMASLPPPSRRPAPVTALAGPRSSPPRSASPPQRTRSSPRPAARPRRAGDLPVGTRSLAERPPGTASGPADAAAQVAQRQEATAAPTAEAGAPPASEAADAAAPAASAAPAAPGANPERELEDLARRIYPRIQLRLRRDLLLDLERHGRHAEVPR